MTSKEIFLSKTSIPSIILPIHTQAVLENRMFPGKVHLNGIFYWN